MNRPTEKRLHFSAKILIASVALALPVVLGSCTAMRSQSVPVGDEVKKEGKIKTVKGAAYCLPIGKIKVRVTRYGNGPAARGKAKLALMEARGELDAANAESVKLKAAQKVLDTESAAAAKAWKDAPAGNSKEALAAEATKAQKLADENSAKITEISNKIKTVTTTIKTLELSAITDTPFYRISHVSTDYYPDRAKQFAVRYSPNAMADDQIEVQVGADSLLRSVDVKVKDMSVEASKKLFEIGKNLLEAYYRGTAAIPFGGATEITVFEGSFDPVNAEELAEVNAALRGIEGGGYRVKVVRRSDKKYTAEHTDYDGGKTAVEAVSSTKESSVSGRRNVPGVAYRPVLAYDVFLYGPKETENETGGESVHQIATVMLPNEAEVLYFPLARSAFVQRNTNLQFEHGMLTKVTLSKPSEINAALDIPLELSRTLAALPGQLAAASIDGMKTRRQLHDEHLGFLEKELAYDAKLRELKAGQKGKDVGEQIKSPGDPIPGPVAPKPEIKKTKSEPAPVEPTIPEKVTDFEPF